MRVFIIEDEVPAQINLKRALKHNFDEVEFVGRADSVAGAVEWFRTKGNRADITFMDVELSDGRCFEIFKQVEVPSKVIITTAYDNYAIQAFKVNSIDYLLKPVDHKELVEAVVKCLHQSAGQLLPDIASIENALAREYKQRFAVKIGERIVIVPLADIAYFYSEEKTSYIVTQEGKQYIINHSLDSVMGMLDPREFFRISRAFIVHISSIKSASKHLGGRLKIILEPRTQEDMFVSRVKINDFINWLDGQV